MGFLAAGAVEVRLSRVESRGFVLELGGVTRERELSLGRVDLQPPSRQVVDKDGLALVQIRGDCLPPLLGNRSSAEKYTKGIPLGTIKRGEDAQGVQCGHGDCETPPSLKNKF